MADDFVNDISPLNQIAPIRPHPSNIRQERRRRGKRHSKDRKRRKNRGFFLKDKVSVLAKRHDDLQDLSLTGKKNFPKDENEPVVRHIDIRV